MPRHLVLIAVAALAVSLGAVVALGPGPDRATATTVVPLTSSSPSPSSSTSATLTPPATGLDPGLVRAFEAAVVAAGANGHELTITSGFRTAAEQQDLLDAEIRERGSVSEALRWVFTPDRSMHVRGLAIDVGDGDAATWLDGAGARFGLCRTLEWEWWHFEWREAWARDQHCPAPVDDPADAPT